MRYAKAWRQSNAICKDIKYLNVICRDSISLSKLTTCILHSLVKRKFKDKFVQVVDKQRSPFVIILKTCEWYPIKHKCRDKNISPIAVQSVAMTSRGKANHKPPCHSCQRYFSYILRTNHKIWLPFNWILEGFC